MSRWKAALIHLAISAMIAVSLLLVIFFVLYPPPLFKAMGGSELALLVISVDVFLGPILTLAVFKSGKKSLKFDLSVVALLQFSALIYGLGVVWVARPVFVVARQDVAYVVSATDIRAEDLAKGSAPQFQKFSWTGPVYAGLAMPQTDAERQRILDLNLDKGRDIQQMPEFYRPWEQIAPDMLKHAEPLEDLRFRKPQFKDTIDDWLAQRQRKIDSVRYLSLLTFHAELCLVLDAQTGAMLGILDIDAS